MFSLENSKSFAQTNPAHNNYSSNIYFVPNDQDYVIKGIVSTNGTFKLKVTDPEHKRLENRVILVVSGRKYDPRKIQVHHLEMILKLLSKTDCDIKATLSIVDNDLIVSLGKISSPSRKEKPLFNNYVPDKTKSDPYLSRDDFAYLSLPTIVLGISLPFSTLTGASPLMLILGKVALTVAGSAIAGGGFKMLEYGLKSSAKKELSLEGIKETLKGVVIGGASSSVLAIGMLASTILPSAPAVAIALSGATGEAVRQTLDGEKANLKSMLISAGVGSLGHNIGKLVHNAQIYRCIPSRLTDNIPKQILQDLQYIFNGAIACGAASGSAQMAENILTDKPLTKNVANRVISGSFIGGFTGALVGADVRKREIEKAKNEDQKASVDNQIADLQNQIADLQNQESQVQAKIDNLSAEIEENKARAQSLLLDIDENPLIWDDLDRLKYLEGYWKKLCAPENYYTPENRLKYDKSWTNIRAVLDLANANTKIRSFLSNIRINDYSPLVEKISNLFKVGDQLSEILSANLIYGDFLDTNNFSIQAHLSRQNRLINSSLEAVRDKEITAVEITPQASESLQDLMEEMPFAIFEENEGEKEANVDSFQIYEPRAKRRLTREEKAKRLTKEGIEKQIDLYRTKLESEPSQTQRARRLRKRIEGLLSRLEEKN